MKINSQSLPPAVWLDLAEAAQLLGVHFTTLRRWADEGQIRHMRTPGGRRRFALDDLERFLMRRQAGASTEYTLNTASALEQAALNLTRAHLRKFVQQKENHLAVISETERQDMRQSGRRLLGLLIRYAANDDENGEMSLKEARRIAHEYGQMCYRFDMTMGDALRAFLFFRRSILESLLDVHLNDAADGSEPIGALFQRVSQFTDELLLTMTESYCAVARPVFTPER